MRHYYLYLSVVHRSSTVGYGTLVLRWAFDSVVGTLVAGLSLASGFRFRKPRIRVSAIASGVKGRSRSDRFFTTKIHAVQGAQEENSWSRSCGSEAHNESEVQSLDQLPSSHSDVATHSIVRQEEKQFKRGNNKAMGIAGTSEVNSQNQILLVLSYFGWKEWANRLVSSPHRSNSLPPMRPGSSLTQYQEATAASRPYSTLTPSAFT